MSKVKTITVKNASTNATETISAAVSQIYYNDKNNLNIETTSDDIIGGKGGKINIESASDIQFKPGDDMIIYSHHRAADKQDEVSVKITDGNDKPVKFQLNASEVTLTTKDKTGDKSNVMDVTVNSDKGTRGYLKVRAQAIDLRSESHGGIALQPKGYDSDNNMNKIKFEHGGGDGLEFGTFNTEKTSIFTDEYRFNKNGKVMMATRVTTPSDKFDPNDTTTTSKYVKQADDFYDVIDENDKKTTWEGIINAGDAFEDGGLSLDDCSTVSAEHKVSKKGNVDGGIPTIGYTITNNLPATYAKLQENGGTITEDQYNTLIAEWTDKPTSSKSVSFKDLIDIVSELIQMKSNNEGPWAA